jgi:ketosteroid isomerase-like protein
MATSALPQEQPLSKDQQEIWNREEAYLTAVRTRNADAYLSLFHEDFVGWPYFDHDPVRKSDVRKDPFPLHRNSENVVETYDSKRKAVQMFGETAVVHYLVTITSNRDGKETARTARITHTWMKTHGVWLIVGGMSSLVEPPEPSK